MPRSCFINAIQALPQCNNSPKLQEAITCAKFAHMGVDGDQSYDTIYYNLDVIISVGYRVKSRQGTHFRQWANRILKEYLLKGYNFNQYIAGFEHRIEYTLHEHTKQIYELQKQVDAKSENNTSQDLEKNNCWFSYFLKKV